VRNAETLIPFLVAVIALLGYIAWAVRRLAKTLNWFRRLPREHEWLMKQVQSNTDAIRATTTEVKDLATVIRALIEGR